MTAYDVEPGDSVHPGDPVTVDRYTAGARVNHWITATCLVLLALSGLALFSPWLFFSFFGLFIRFWRANLWKAEDGTWLARLRDVISGHEERLPEVGKYNAGQKAVFWLMSILIIVLISSGLVMWDQYFYGYTNIEQKRIAVLVHSAAA